MKKPTLSVAVITKNEADRIGRLLQSAQFANEMLVVDSGSTDHTRDLCRSHRATVLEHPWMGYAAQKQFALEKAGSQWVLCLDADEAVSEGLAQEICTAIASAPADVAGFSMPGFPLISGAGSAMEAGIRTVRSAWCEGGGDIGLERRSMKNWRWTAEFCDFLSRFYITYTVTSPTNSPRLIAFPALQQRNGAAPRTLCACRPGARHGKVCRMLYVESRVPGRMAGTGDCHELGVVCLPETRQSLGNEPG